MDLHAFALFKSATDPTARRKLRDALVVANDPLVRSCASKLAKGDADDLLQAGRMGVMKALEKFDLSHKVRGEALRNPGKAWREYAKQWIRDEMMLDVVARRAIVRTAPKVTDRIIDGKRVQKRVISNPLLVTGSDGKEQDWNATAPGWNGPGPLGLSDTTPQPTILTPAFWRALASLTEQEARVFLAIVVDEKTVTEAAAAEGHRVEWGTQTYRKALGKLRADMGVPAAPASAPTSVSVCESRPATCPAAPLLPPLT